MTLLIARLWSVVLAVTACALLAAPPRQAIARELPPAFMGLHHTGWSVKDGAPGPVTALAQTPDGWLWVGTPTGLFRFDGLRFEAVQMLAGQRLPASNIRSLLVSPSGALWIGDVFGGITCYEDNRLTHYGSAEGLPGRTILRLAAGSDETVWAAAASGIYRLRHGRWEAAGPTQPRTVDVLVDRRLTVWVRSGHRLFRRGRDDTLFRDIGPASDSDVLRMVEAADGAVWVPDGHADWARYDPSGRLQPGGWLPGPQGRGQVLFDRASGVWSAAGEGLARQLPMSSPQEARRPQPPFTVVDGLTGEQVYTMLEDREGLVWVGTNRGLDRFRPTKLTRVGLPAGFSRLAIAPADGGALWVSSEEGRLLRVDADGRHEQALLGPDITAAYRDRDGSLWLGNMDGRLWHLAGARPTEVEAPLGVAGRQIVQAIARDAAGSLWLSAGGLHRLDPTGWTRMSGRDGLPPGKPITMALDRQGVLWLGYPGNRVVRFAGRHAQVFDAASGLDVGNVLCLQPGDSGLWVGGDAGVSLWRDGRFHVLTGQDGTLFAGVSGIVETAQHELWLNGTGGVSHIAADELARFIAHPAQRPHFERFDHRDGVEGSPAQIAPLPSAVQGADGRLWFATDGGLAWVDPEAVPSNPLSPPIAVRSLKAGGIERPAGSKISLPPGTSAVEVGYTALSLAIPERVQFRYRLDGVDTDWQDAGNRRVAYYTNLGPGQYRFRVTAANNDGVWAYGEAALDFTVEPAWHQTRAVRLLALLLGLSLLYGAYRLRMRYVTRQLGERLRERQQERDRIAGELHDTLLQSIQALILRLQVAVDRLPQHEPARRILERSIEYTEQATAEARDRVSGLRAMNEPHTDLPSQLRRAAAELSLGEAEARVEVDGRERDLQPTVIDELYGAAREAMLNALRHAQAREIVARLHYGYDLFTIQVSDDGRGIDPAVLDLGRQPGHWGLVVMRERVQRIGGALHLSTGEAEGRLKGTTVTLEVPAGRAYLQASLLQRLIGWWWRHRPGAGHARTLPKTRR